MEYEIKKVPGLQACATMLIRLGNFLRLDLFVLVLSN